MKIIKASFILAGLTFLPAGGALADKITQATTKTANIIMTQTGEVVATLTAATLPTAGAWGSGTPSASLAVSILNGSATQRPAARWTQAYSGQSPVTGCDACRDVQSVGDASATLPLKLTCGGASSDVDQWQYAPTGTVLTCSIETYKQQAVVAGNYKLSIDAAMRTD